MEGREELPSGENQVASPSLYMGKGRRDWATLAVQGKPAYGSLKPAATAAVEQICEVSKVRVAALVRSRPKERRRAGEIAFMDTRPRASSQAPRFPT